MILGYARVSTNEQSLDAQVKSIEAYCYRNDFKCDEIIQVKVSSRRGKDKRGLDDLDRLGKGDRLIVVALDRLGRSTLEVLNLIEDLTNRWVEVHIINENLVLTKDDSNPLGKLSLTVLAAFAEMERAFISRRTKEALAARKAQGVKLGRPKGSIGKSKYDKDADKIIELYKLGVPITKIIDTHLKYGTHQSLTTWLKKRKHF